VFDGFRGAGWSILHGMSTEPVSDAADEPVTAPEEGSAPSGPAEKKEATAAAAPASEAATGRPAPAYLVPFLLLRAAHPRQALATAIGVAAVAALADRPTREVLVVLATVLVGQVVLGWHNDLVDRERDRRHDLPGKPVAQGRLDPGTVWFALICGVLLVGPLSVATGVTAGCFYLGSLLVAALGNLVLRQGLLSWLPWAASYALYPAYLSFGGWGGEAVGDPPEPLIVALAALLGIGVHVLRALWGLVPDHADGWTYLPLRLGVRLGASRLLALVSVYLVLVVAGLIAAGTSVGLTR
jgi:4-hydroxybenzoate polyprenyltransferase